MKASALHRLAHKRHMVTRQARAHIDGIYRDLDEITQHRNYLLELSDTRDHIAEVDLQWAGAFASKTAELVDLGVLTGDAADDVARKLIAHCRKAVIDTMPDGMADTTYGVDTVDAFLEGITEGLAGHPGALIEAVGDISAYLSWVKAVYIAVGNLDTARLRLLSIAAPVAGARILARHCGDLVLPIHDRLVCRHLIREAARALTAQADRARSQDVVRHYRRRGPPCRRTASRTTRCAPIGANAPPAGPRMGAVAGRVLTRGC
ncbi:MAG: hypothetical protein AB7W59_14140 [Acidimicrobiia bacterium]